MFSSAMDFLEIKSENSLHELNSRSECTSPLDGTSNANVYGRIADFRGKIMNGQIKLKEKRGRSRVWNIFASLVDESGDEIEHFVACRSCFNVYKYANCTSNLVKHKCYLSYEAKENGSSISQDVEVDGETKNKLNDAAAQWLVTNCRPLSILDDSGLKNMARIFLSIGATFGENVNIDSIWPRQPTVENNISELYESQRQKIIVELNRIKCNGYSITSYVWTDSYIKRPFVSVTTHYVKQSAMASRLLAVCPLNSATIAGNHIEEKVKQCLQNFDCDLAKDDPIIVTDSNENFTTAFHNHHHIHCIINLLSNTIEKVFREVPQLQQMLDKCIELVKHCLKSGETFSLQSSLSFTRRNPILYYLNTVKDNWHDLSNILIHNSDVPMHINDIKAVVSILQSFEQTSLALEDDNMPTLHMIIPHLHKLKKICLNIDEDSPLATVLKNALKRHIDLIASNHITKYHKIALFLFPPTKKLLLFDESERKATITECKLMMQQYYVETDSSRKKIKIDIEYCGDGIFSDFIEQTSSDTKIDTINNEINEYLARKITLSEVFYVLEWWQANKVVFPLLYKVSCKILGTPASIAPSQRAILQARNLLSASSTSIPCDDDMINEIIFLNNNYKY